MSDKSRPSLQHAPAQRSVTDEITKRKSSFSTSSVGSDAPVISIAKTLAQLRSIPTNRSCADCRSPLIDAAQTFASFSPQSNDADIADDAPVVVSPSVGAFRSNHEAFAPTKWTRMRVRARSKVSVDPAIRVTEQLGGYGVFLCSECAKAHKSMGSSVAVVRSVQDSSKWTTADVTFFSEAGGNAKSWTVLEGFMSEAWKKRRPTNTSTMDQRQIFCRAKYDALAFLTPQGGPLAPKAWREIVDSQNDLGRFRTEDLLNFSRITLSEGKTKSLRRLESSTEDPLPSRLVDFFCVVSHTGKLERGQIEQDLGAVSSPEELRLESKVVDCYPDQDTYDGFDFPEHVATFVYPEGCRPSEHHKAPNLFTFVFTSANGQRIYGAALHVYDESVDTDEFRGILEESGYTVPLPWWLLQEDAPSGKKAPSEVTYMPKCLVVLSHYPFFDLWRRFLKQLYRITIVEAPLPVERYIANFVSEVPLPPQGKIEVKFGFTEDEIWTVSRPAPNKLPLANFSYRPLFASLSVGNIMVIIGLLIQETRVVLLSRYYSLLTPVAESLLSLLFPFEWQGMYIPVMPYAMLDILDAPVPFLVGLHSRYLTQVDPSRRPRGVVFVDLDRDTIHLGSNEEEETDENGNLFPRSTPDLPERDASKLKSKLEEFGGMAYLVPDSGVKGRILTGDGTLLINSHRQPYAYMTHVEGAKTTSIRSSTLADTRKAFLNNTPITVFLSEQGQLAGRDSPQIPSKKERNLRKQFFQRGRKGSSAPSDASLKNGVVISLLDLHEGDGFSTEEIRSAFLRFFVTMFSQYERFLSSGENGALFHNSEFLASLHVSLSSKQFISNIIETQMFQAFLEERKKNPNDYEILYFDESIIAKNNRSKKTTLTTGKQQTPFLKDTSGEITDIFTPPAPSNWGLPDDGRGYQYGTFPKLNRELIGKVRSVKQWPQETQKAHRRSKAKTSAFLKQQELMRKTLQPSTKIPRILTNGQSKNKVGDMEWAIGALSKEGDSSTSIAIVKGKEWSGPTEQLPPEQFPARQRILSARRKQSILIEIIVKIQACYRRHIAQKRFRERRKAVLVEQRHSRHFPSQMDIDDQRQRDARAVERKRLRGAICLQSLVRGAQARDRFLRLKAALLIQRWTRGVNVRRYIVDLRRATVKLQSFARGRNARFAFFLFKSDIGKAQAHCRGYLTRKVVFSLMEQRSLGYREQIFILWLRAHAPLSYRTKLWPLLKKSGFLHLSLAERELKRLWQELHIPFSSPSLLMTLLKHGDNLATAAELGLANQCFGQFAVVRHMIDKYKKEGLSEEKLWFPAERTPSLQKAAARERAERVQIYERLRAITDQATLDGMYKKFCIEAAEKTKKVKLANKIWLDLSFARRSMSAMASIFPELKHSTDMQLVSPSKKALKTFRTRDAMMSPLDDSLHVEANLDQLMKADMKEFAIACVDKMPSLLIQMRDHEREASEIFLRRRNAAMAARKITNWPDCRFEIILSFLRPNEHNPSKAIRRAGQWKDNQ